MKNTTIANKLRGVLKNNPNCNKKRIKYLIRIYDRLALKNGEI